MCHKLLHVFYHVPFITLLTTIDFTLGKITRQEDQKQIVNFVGLIHIVYIPYVSYFAYISSNFVPYQN